MGDVVWLASYPKSGNTWVRAFLCNLFGNTQSPLHLEEISKVAVSDADIRWYQRYLDKPADEFTDQDFAKLRPKVHRDMSKAGSGPVFVKTHSVVGTWCDVPLVTKECTAGAIYVVRNPLDVCVSAAAYFGLGIDATIDWMGDKEASVGEPERGLGRQIISSWSHHVYSWTSQPGLPLMLMRYEDMMQEAPKTFGTLARFLGLNPPHTRLDRAIEFSSFETLHRLEQEHGFRERGSSKHAFFRSGRTDQWREVLSRDQVERLVKGHRGQMMRFGYLPEDG